jgi:hypothetical protein
MRRILSLAAALSIGTAALANDSTAEIAAGRLVLRQSHDIDMVSEDLFVSVDRVRVRYVFRNRSAQPVRAIVAFPIGARDLANEYETDVAAVGEFRTLVDGQAVQMKVERKAFARGIDQTALLQQLGIPVDANGDASERIAKLPRAEQDRLKRLGLVTSEPDITPAWTFKETWYWEQVFPPGRDMKVEHSYRPGAGSSAGEPLAIPDLRNSADGRRRMELYCADRGFIASLDRLTRAGGEGGGLASYWIDYVLTTGGNWRSPIGDFRLVVDKGKPDNLVSFCETGVRKISSTQFEGRMLSVDRTRKSISPFPFVAS